MEIEDIKRGLDREHAEATKAKLSGHVTITTHYQHGLIKRVTKEVLGDLSPGVPPERPRHDVPGRNFG